ncbi:hypothetical protein [Rummeliibacillus suwonensis]|uniref:hypothetical protein n=1 Tax=Rummeliibacillus suwonensis TaxID=1306154 RepID=UPI0011B411FE|nr:hypothetical protein [Rummeliibacillus suwonensis]MBO2535646.1 hypothetical protein [Rummeliibacillus suwonensis]
MDAEEVWESLIVSGSEKPIELKTKTGLHFNLVSNGKHLTVRQSNRQPSSKLKSPRTIYKDNFIKVFPYYPKWLAHEKGISTEITAITGNASYIMAAINDR